MITVATDRRREWNLSDDIDKVELSMEMSDLMYKSEKLRSNKTIKNQAGGLAYIAAKKRLIEIMEMPE